MSIAEKLQTIAENEQKVYDAGKKAEYDAFWDAYQNNGEPTVVTAMYAYSVWTDATYKPKYAIRASISSFTNTFAQTNISSTIVDIDARGKLMSTTFSYATSLKTIPNLIVDESTTFTNPFKGTTGLINLTITGTIGQNGFNVSSCTKLSHDSLMSIINALQSGVSSLTVTLGTTNLNKLTDTEKAIATEKGWTLA